MIWDEELVWNCFWILKCVLFIFLDPLKLDMPEEKSTASQQQQSTSKTLTEEELEEWLDSMIS